jgi:hypothetical protein
VDQIDEGFEDSVLPERLKLVVRLTDALLAGGHVAPALKAQVVDEFGADGFTELALTIAFASGFSKAAVAWGPPPELPVMEVPTPAPGGDVNNAIR